MFHCCIWLRGDRWTKRTWCVLTLWIKRDSGLLLQLCHCPQGDSVLSGPASTEMWKMKVFIKCFVMRLVSGTASRMLLLFVWWMQPFPMNRYEHFRAEGQEIKDDHDNLDVLAASSDTSQPMQTCILPLEQEKWSSPFPGTKPRSNEQWHVWLDQSTSLSDSSVNTTQEILPMSLYKQRGATIPKTWSRQRSIIVSGQLEPILWQTANKVLSMLVCRYVFVFFLTCSKYKGQKNK